jgi:hypothetical protein
MRMTAGMMKYISTNFATVCAVVHEKRLAKNAAMIKLLFILVRRGSACTRERETSRYTFRPTRKSEYADIATTT